MAEEQPKFGSFVHVEIPAKDRNRCKEFYADVFGWKFTEVPEMDYTMFEAANPPHGGIRPPMEGDPGVPLNYILVRSIDETARKIEEAGGKIVVPKGEVLEMGWFSIFTDPEGVILALWEEAPKKE